MKGSGIFRGGIARAVKLFDGKKSSTTEYADPKLSDRSHGRRKIKGEPGKQRLGVPPCIPGTITYRDRLVRHLGYDRRLADAMLREWRETGKELPKL